MRDYYGQRRSREPVVRMMLDLGFSAASTANIMGIQDATIREDAAAYGYSRNHGTRGAQSFPVAVTAYARLLASGDDAGTARKVRSLLGAWIGVDSIRRELDVALTGVSMLLRPDYPAGKEWFGRLVEHMRSESVEIPQASHIIDAYLSAIAQGTETAAPNRAALERYLLTKEIRKLRPHIMPIASEAACAMAERQLERLDERVRACVRAYIGIDGPPQTQEKIGESMRVSKSRVGQLLEKAAEALRRQCVDLGYELYRPTGGALEYYLARVTDLRKREEACVQAMKEVEAKARECSPALSQVSPHYLYMQVNELELSVRASGVLKTLQVVYVSDLVQLQEVEVHRTRNCGRKTVQELQDCLESMGLRFGMVFTPDQQRLLQAARSSLSPPVA